MKIVIVGKGYGWEEAPMDGEVWGITQMNLRRPFTLCIDMNDYRLWGEKEAREAAMSRTLAMHQEVPYIDLDNYPILEIVKEFGTDYFSSTIDYAIALAIHRGATEIDLYGVTMLADSEYAYQKPGVDFWCGFAKGRGIDVTVHGEHSAVMRTRDGKLYGYGTEQGNLSRPHN